MKNTSTSFLKKLAEFKQENINIPKDTKAYGYKYAPLDTILPIIEPLLKKHGLSYLHKTGIDDEQGRLILKTVIYEVETSGNSTIGGFLSSEIFIDDTVTLAKMNKFMVIGSALTYFRRYHLVTMLGLLTDEDTDADGAPGGGRSIESKTKETDWTPTFVGLIEKGQTEKQVRAFFKKYEANFNSEQHAEIGELISESFSK